MGGQITIMVMVLCGSLGFAMYLEIVRRARVALGWDARNTVSRHWSTYSWLVVRMDRRSGAWRRADPVPD